MRDYEPSVESSSSDKPVIDPTMSCHIASDAHAPHRNVFLPLLTTAGFSPQRVHMNVKPFSIALRIGGSHPLLKRFRVDRSFRVDIRRVRAFYPWREQ
jgi:hypothetical protein